MRFRFKAAFAISLFVTLCLAIPWNVSAAVSSSAVFNNTIYIGGGDGNLWSSALPGLSLNWTFATGGAIVSSPAIAIDGTIYFGSMDGYITPSTQMDLRSGDTQLVIP